MTEETAPPAEISPFARRGLWLTIAARHSRNALDYRALANSPDAMAIERSYTGSVAVDEDARAKTARLYADETVPNAPALEYLAAQATDLDSELAVALLDFEPEHDDCAACSTSAARHPEDLTRTAWPHDECPYHLGAFAAWDEARRQVAAVFSDDS